MENFAFFLKMLSTVFMAGITAITSIFSPVASKDICMIAHRGYSGIYPENTELAFEMAAKHGSGGAETDIRRTKDGVYVTSHDNEVEYKDGTTLIIEENTFEQLSAKPIKNGKTFDTVYLCTFKRYLEIMRDNNMICFVELKGEYTDEQIKEIFALVSDTYSLEKCIMQSFSFENLIKIRTLVPDLPVMLTYGSDDEGYERCFEYNFSIDANINQLSEEMINEFHEHGLYVAAYTANTPIELAYAKTFDIDFLESDYYA